MNPITHVKGQAIWTPIKGDEYVVTGITKIGKRFKITSESWFYIQGINLWRGTKWLLRDGRKYRIQSVYN